MPSSNPIRVGALAAGALLPIADLGGLWTSCVAATLSPSARSPRPPRLRSSSRCTSPACCSCWWRWSACTPAGRRPQAPWGSSASSRPSSARGCSPACSGFLPSSRRARRSRPPRSSTPGRCRGHSIWGSCSRAWSSWRAGRSWRRHVRGSGLSARGGRGPRGRRPAHLRAAARHHRRHRRGRGLAGADHLDGRTRASRRAGRTRVIPRRGGVEKHERRAGIYEAPAP